MRTNNLIMEVKIIVIIIANKIRLSFSLTLKSPFELFIFTLLSDFFHVFMEKK